MAGGAVLVLDIGSSSVKAVLFGETGDIRAQGEASYPTTAKEGHCEQWPLDWEAAAADAIRKLGSVAGIQLLSLSGTMQNVIPVGADFAPLAPAMLYSDARAADRAEALAQAVRRIGAERRIGNAIDPLMSAAKLDWLRAMQPEIFGAAHLFHTCAKDYLASRLTGASATDATAASTTGLMDLWTRDWDEAMLTQLSFDRAKLPVILPADRVVGYVSVDAARRFEVPAGVPVMNGCGDAGAATLGAGLDRPDRAYVYLGTTGWVAKCAAARLRDPLPVYTLAHPLPDMLIEIAPILSAGDCVVWITDVLGTSIDAPETERGLANADADPSDLVFLPYLKGERSPFSDSAVRGAFFGLERGHCGSDFLLAVLEGVAFAIRHNLEGLGGAQGGIAMLGGGGSNLIWAQALADILDTEVVVPSQPAAVTALGVFRLAAKRLGWTESGPARKATFSPRAARRDRARRLYARYRAASAFARALNSVAH